jgi:CRISPR-associated protein Csd1
LEKIQQEASPAINATIKDRFWGAASATPKIVFPQLLNLKNHHISKMSSQGKAIFFEKLVGSIMDQIDSMGFKTHFTLDEQGLFTIGYYHQRQDFFKSKESLKDNQ